MNDELVQHAEKFIRLAAQSQEPVACIRLRPDEIQSGLDRVRWAEGLIRQLPDNHDGRNSWLANYAGDKHDADKIRFTAQTDYEQRIRSALVNAPMPASTTGRQALNEVVTNGEWTEGDQCGEWKISKAVYDLAVEARDSIIAASEATKSDGGVEGHAKCDSPIRSAPAKHPQVAESLNEQGHDADIAGIKPGPSDLDSRLERLQVEASDLGYVLTREPEHPDSPHASDTRPADVTASPEATLSAEILAELTRARAKFPGKNVTFAALVEEVGELATATFEEGRDRVRKEAVQVAVMAMRMVLDGDHTFDDWRASKGLDCLVEPGALLDTYKIGAK